MRIISKQHDYYDSIAGYGIDPKLTYVRQIRRHKGNDHVKLFNYDATDEKNKTVTINEVVVVIAQTQYRFFYRRDLNNVPFNSIGELISCRPELKINKWYLDFRKDNMNLDYTWVNEEYDSPLVILGVDYESPIIYNNNSFGSSDDFVVKKTFFSKSSILTDAPILGMLGLSNHINPVKIWMGIDSWISSHGKEIPNEISNRSKILKAGFDTTFSFRNMKR